MSPAGVVAVLYGVSEIVLWSMRRARAGGGTTTRDRGSLVLVWIVIFGSIVAAYAFSGSRGGRLALSRGAREALAIALMLGGMLLRWIAILRLGRFFTVNVATHEGQRLVDTGPYRFVRHPSYTGSLIAFIGMGIFFGTWAAVAFMLGPITLALLYRIRVEEQALDEALGPAYAAYRARTKRLIPGVL